MRKSRFEGGFSLVELLIYIVIMAILVAMAIPLVAELRTEAAPNRPETRVVQEDVSAGITEEDTAVSAETLQRMAELEAERDAAQAALREQENAEPSAVSAPVVLGVLGTVGAALASALFLFLSVLPRRRAKRTEKLRLLQEQAALNLRFEKVTQRFTRVQDEYTTYLLDVRSIVQLPALSDVSVTETRVFLENYVTLEDQDWKSVPASEELSRLEESVARTEVAWRAAQAFAKRHKHGLYSLEEQKRLRTAESLLRIALDPAASANERQMAYKKTISLLEGLVTIPAKAAAALESQTLLALTATATPAPEVPAPRSETPSLVSRLLHRDRSALLS